MVLNEDGIIEETSNNTTKIKWNETIKVYKDNNNIYIYTTSSNAFVIPLKYLDETTEATRIFDFIKSKIVSDNSDQIVDKTKNSNTGKKIIGFLFSGISVYLLVLSILGYVINYDIHSASIVSLFLSFVGAVLVSKISSKYSWTVIFISFLMLVGFSVLIISLFK
jgi:hypothetical protein